MIRIAHVGCVSATSLAEDVSFFLEALQGSLLDEGGTPGFVVGAELFKALDNLGVFGEIRPVSAHEGEGLGDIHARAQMQFFGGEDTVRE